MFAGSPGERVRGEITILASVSELVACEVIIAGIPGETVIVGVAELASAPGVVAIESVVSNSLWAKFGVILETGVLFSVE